MALLCRTCLATSETMYNIFSHVENNKFLSDMLMEHTLIEVRKDDGLPVHICGICLKKLNLTREFKAMVTESDVKLHNLYCKDINLQNYDSNHTICDTKELKFEEHDSLSRINDSNLQNVLSNDSNESIKDNGDSNENIVLQTQEKEIIVCKQEEYVDREEKIGYGESKQILVDVYSNSDKKQIDTALLNVSLDSDMIDLNNTEHNSSDEKEFNKKINTVRDEKKLTDQKRFFCKECNRYFGYRYYFGIHMRTHTGDTPYKCDQCDKRFALPYLLSLHKRNHLESKPYSCQVCGKSFKFASSIPNHMVTHTNVRTHKCDVCSKMFKSEIQLRAHLLTHSDKKSFVCEVCGKSFTDKTGLSHHTQTHNEKTLPCPTCGKRFSMKSYMTAHINRAHLKVKRHACDYCDKRFNSPKVLRNHLLIHTGEKPHACKVCGKTFTQLSCITRHMRIHTGETPYPCKLCSASFKYSHHLLNHMKVHQ